MTMTKTKTTRSTSTDFENFFGTSENSKVVKTTNVIATLPTNKGNVNAGM